jgi:hypothetical protein
MDAVKAFKQVRQLIIGNADAGVPHGKNDVAGSSREW